MRRSMLFLPGNTPNMLINGGFLGADAVILDLAPMTAEAIQGQGARSGQGLILVDVRRNGACLSLTVRDNGPGLSDRAMQNLFRVGYSTKFGDSAGDFSPLANLMVHGGASDWIRAAGSKRAGGQDPGGWPVRQDRQDNLGFTYAQLDDYIVNGNLRDSDHRPHHLDDAPAQPSQTAPDACVRRARAGVIG